MKRTFIDSAPIGAGWAALEYMWIVEYMKFHIFGAVGWLEYQCVAKEFGP